MSTCERCGEKPIGELELMDYCNICGTNLCPKCMRKGCCDIVPAQSGELACTDWEAQ